MPKLSKKQIIDNAISCEIWEFQDLQERTGVDYKRTIKALKKFWKLLNQKVVADILKDTVDDYHYHDALQYKKDIKIIRNFLKYLE